MKFLKAATLATLTALALTGCSAQPPSAQPTPVAVTACILGDSFGLDDHSVGGASYLGLLQAQAQYGIKIRTAQVSATATNAEYQDGLKTLLGKGCNLVVGVGSATDVVEVAATKYPKTKFVVVHGRPYALGETSKVKAEDLENVKSLSYDSAQGGFLAGYLAATKTKTHTVGAFGATLNRAEVALLAGFFQGVKYANETAATAVTLYGHNRADSWQAVGKNNTEGTRTATIQLIEAGADVVFPVVGDAESNGAALPTLEMLTTNPNVSLIGSVSNWYQDSAAREIRASVMSSVVLSIQKDVADCVGQVIAGTFVGGSLGSQLGNLSNGGVSLAGPNDIAFPASYTTQVGQITSWITDGTIRVKSQLK